MKKTFPNPLIVLTTAGTNDIGGGSLPGGLDSIKPFPMSYDEWTNSRWCKDSDGNGGMDFADYVDWWSKSGLGAESWAQFNPDVAWNEELTE